MPLIGGSDKIYQPRDFVYCEHNIPEVFLNLFNFEKEKGVMDIRHPDGKMIRSKQWKYNYYPRGYEELYDMVNDPNEWNNLANNDQYKQVKIDLKKYLPSSEAPLVLEGKALHNVVDADQPSLEKFQKLWAKMQGLDMNLE